MKVSWVWEVLTTCENYEKEMKAHKWSPNDRQMGIETDCL